MIAATHRYSVYGVGIRSDWPLALPAERDPASHLAEVEFVHGSDEDFADADSVRHSTAPGFVSHILPDRSTYLQWAGLYEFLVVPDGTRVACRPLGEENPIALQNLLFNPALSFALLRQGLEPLHASVLQVDDVAIGLLGDCSFGKSTLLAAFLQAGHRLVTDDLLMVATGGSQPMAQPGSGRVKLHPDSAAAFITPDTESEPIAAQTAKRAFPVADGLLGEIALPLTHLFVLPTPSEREAMGAVAIEPLPRVALFQELLKSSFNVVVFDRDRLERQFAWTARLSNEIAGFRLAYPSGLHHLPLVRESIVNHVRHESANRRLFQ